MTRKIGIIGMGNVGAALAHSLVVAGTADDYVLIDKNEAKVRSDVLDFQDMVANTGREANFVVNDYSALVDADVVVSALGNIKLITGTQVSRFAELPHNSQEVKEVGEQLKASGFQGILVVITNPVDVISQLYQDYTGFAPERIIGTGTLLDPVRMKRVVGQRFGLSATSVTGYNLGEHGNSQFTAWSQVTVKGQPISQLLTEEELTALAQDARMGGYHVLVGKGYTNYAIAAAAKALVEAILTNSRAILPVSHYQPDHNLYFGYPAIVGRTGLLERIKLDLTDQEQELLAQSIKEIRNYLDLARSGEFE